MNLLCLGVDSECLSEFKKKVEPIAGIKVYESENSENALKLIETENIDLFLTSLNEGKNDEVRLNELLDLISNSAPLTPVYVLTEASIDVAEVNILLFASHHVDILRTGDSFPTLKLLLKTDIQALISEIEKQHALISKVDNIPINSGGRNLFLKASQKRVIRVFSNQFGGASCRVAQLDGGLSSSRVLNLHVVDANDVTRINAVAKIDRVAKIDKETKNYYQEVARLPVRAYAPSVGIIKGGTSGTAGIFYRLLTPTDKTLYEVFEINPGNAALIVNELRELISSWHDAKVMKQIEIKEVRQMILSDDEISLIAQTHNIDWIQEIERVLVHANISCIHGDLHGANIYVSDENKPLMIDFGDVCEGASVLDPITLELSLFTHPSIKGKITWNPDTEVTQWSVIDDYLKGCPYSEFIDACRKWSHDIAGGDQVVNAGAYAYLIKQLKYRDVDKELVLKLLESVKESILHPD